MAFEIPALLRRVLTIAALCAVALAHGAPSQKLSIDDLYFTLGQGDDARALEMSAALLAQVPDNDRKRADVLQARLDTLYQVERVAGAEGDALHSAITHFAAHDSRGAALEKRFDVLDALAHKHAQDALNTIAALAVAPKSGTDFDVAELRAVEARVAALVDGHLEQARVAAQAALDYFAKQKGLRSVWVQVEMRHYVGEVYNYTGSKADALAQFDAAYELAVGTFGANSGSRIKIDLDRATTLSDLGRRSEALAVREASLQATRQRYGDASIEAAKAESMIGASLQEIGDYPAASARYAHAVEVVAQIKNPPVHEVGIINANYGNLLQEMGQSEASLEQYRKALAAWQDEPSAQRARAVVYANTGNTEFRMARYDDAIADFQKALALREQTDGKEAPGLAYSLEGLGSASIALHRFADAQKYFERALQVRGRALSPNHPTLAIYNFGLAVSHWGQGHIDEAFRYATLTAQNQQEMLATFATEFSERQSVAYRDILVPATALAVTLAAQRGDAQSIATAWHLTMVERGLVARSQAQRLAAARSAKDPKLAAAWSAWRKANSVLGEAWLSTRTKPERLAQLRTDAESAERALWLQIGHAPDGSADKSVSIDQIRQSLPRDGAMIAFTEGVADNSEFLLATGDKPAPDDWYAFTLTADGSPRLQRVGDIAAVSAQVRAWYADLRDPGSDVASLRNHGLALRSVVLDPLAPAGAKQIFVVPEGELFRVSFAALPDKKKGYLIESGTRVHTLGHESDLTLGPVSTTAKALLAGAPDFPLATANTVASRQLCLRAARQGFAAIPNAARELDELHALLAGASSQPSIAVVEGSQATKDHVLAALPQANIIHIATHGFSLDDSCADVGNTRGVTLGAAEDPSAASASALSGLAFSGANVGEGHDPVGVLTAGELGTLDLSNAQWVALSACDSGLGPIGRNEGVFGMRRALRLAGARTVVMSLWQVDDAATAGLMQSLYRARFVEHADVPDAMATAMRSTIAARRAAGQSDHPYYWAAFISEGGWR